MSVTVQHLDELLSKSSATEEFKSAVMELKSGNASAGISFNRGTPPIKALRAVSKLLEEAPELNITHVEITGTSGCSDFVGSMSVNGGEAKYKFDWDCAWRAKEQGFTDHFGYPDQIRASREFGYQCFKKFERVD